MALYFIGPADTSNFRLSQKVCKRILVDRKMQKFIYFSYYFEREFLVCIGYSGLAPYVRLRSVTFRSFGRLVYYSNHIVLGSNKLYKHCPNCAKTPKCVRSVSGSRHAATDKLYIGTTCSSMGRRAR